MVPCKYTFIDWTAALKQKSRYSHSQFKFPSTDKLRIPRYCSRVWQDQPDPNGIFLSLLRIYLRPSGTTPPLIKPALALIATHGTRIDASATIDLLPPLVTMQDVHKYFLRTLRDRHSKSSQAKIASGLLTARREQVDRNLMLCQEKRVRITDMRM
jgi:hypothetical protein